MGVLQSIRMNDLQHVCFFSIFTVIRSFQITAICVGQLVFHWKTKTFLLIREIISLDTIKKLYNHVFTQYQSSMLEMFHMRDNFFDPRVLMQICDKTDACLRCQFLATL